MDTMYEQFKKQSFARNRKIIAARKSGATLEELAKKYGLTTQRISKICEPIRETNRANGA